MRRAYKAARKLIVALVGFTVIVVGLALLVLPGPGLLVIIAGLAILALEFEWAERRVNYMRDKLDKAIEKARRSSKK